jgi:hypothetical protein
MNMGSVELYRINNEYDISEILTHFGSEYAMHALEDKLENIDYTSSLIEPNFVSAYEAKFKLMEEEYPGDSQNIKSVREEVYREIIRLLCDRFNLSFNTVDDTIDLYTAAYYLYDFLVCNRNTIMVNFFTAFIVNNKDTVYNILSAEEIKKNKDSSAAYSKRVYADPKYIAISANITKIINYISTFDIKLSNIFQSVYVDLRLVQFLDNAFADKGNFFRDYYCSVINNVEIAPIIIINIRLALQRIVGDISASHIDELIASSPNAADDNK